MKIIELRKKLLQQSLTAEKLRIKHKVSYQSATEQWSEQMNDKVEILPLSDDTESFYQRFFLTDNEKKLLQDIYLSDFDELIDFDE